MNRFFPKSLFGQTLLILFGGLIVSHLIGGWIYASDRAEAVRAIGGLAAAQRVANLTRLVEEVPVDWRARIVKGLSDPTFRVSLLADPPKLSKEIARGPAAAIKDFIESRLPSRPERDLRIAVSQSPRPFARLPFVLHMPLGAMGSMKHMEPRERRERMEHMRNTARAWRGLQVAIELGGGQWLSFTTALPDTGPAKTWPFFVSMLVMGLVIIAVAIWAVRRMTAPLNVLAKAAERLGKDVGAEPLAEIGTTEMQKATAAFNRMQTRLKRFVENRTLMLAAISHDLRTPLTLLRLRSEGVADAEEREKMLATITEMESMIGATLAFARDEAQNEPSRQMDLATLLASIVDDMADAGLPVDMKPAESIIYECRPAALKRAFTNLIDNAVKYGQRAHTAISATKESIEIVIDDDGPGMPEEELTQAFQPFYRLENSRNRKTGGIGLGLSTALSIIEARGGGLTLSNRTEGGLRARITLPR